MRTSVLTILTGALIAITSANTSLAGPPMTGGSGSEKKGNVLGALNPTEWSWPTMPSMPTMPWAEEPRRIKKKSPSIMTNMNQSAKSGWTKTKRALDPSRLFEGDAESKPEQPKPAKNGFFGGMFKPAADPKEIHTVNDFLSQPQPR